MIHAAAALASFLLLTGALAAIAFQVHAFWSDIAAALAGEVPLRHRVRPHQMRVRSPRPRPVVLVRSVRQQWRAAS